MSAADTALQEKIEALHSQSSHQKRTKPQQNEEIDVYALFNELPPVRTDEQPTRIAPQIGTASMPQPKRSKRVLLADEHIEATTQQTQRAEEIQRPPEVFLAGVPHNLLDRRLYNPQQESLIYATRYLYKMRWVDVQTRRYLDWAVLDQCQLILMFGTNALYWALSIKYEQNTYECPILLSDEYKTIAKIMLISIFTLHEHQYLSTPSIPSSSHAINFIMNSEFLPLNPTDVIRNKLVLSTRADIEFIQTLQSRPNHFIPMYASCLSANCPAAVGERADSMLYPSTHMPSSSSDASIAQASSGMAMQQSETVASPIFQSTSSSSLTVTQDPQSPLSLPSFLKTSLTPSPLRLTTTSTSTVSNPHQVDTVVHHSVKRRLF